jgi:hypothetical protein
LGLGDPRTCLNVGVERDGDGRQDADDRDDDHQLDQREASLPQLLVPEPHHDESSLWSFCSVTRIVIASR